METLRAMALMTAAMAGFAIADGALKGVAGQIAPVQVMWMVGLGGWAGFMFVMWRAGQRFWTRDLFSGPVILRNAAEVASTIAFVTALSLVPLATVSAVIQSVPLLVALGAALVLGERVGPRRWAAILAGMVGVLVILRPGLDGFDPNVLWAVAAATGLATRDLASRAAPAGVTTLQLAMWGFAALSLGGGGLLAVLGVDVVRPDLLQLALLAVAVGFAGAAVYALTAAMRLGDVGAVAPFRYTRLVFALIISMAVFGERPDTATLAGAALVIGSGLFVLWRERRLAANT